MATGRTGRGYLEMTGYLEEQRIAPQVLSVTPTNGAVEVDPNLTEIRVVFDRPMTDGPRFAAFHSLIR
jgi:Bacterial Ig-like domain